MILKLNVVRLRIKGIQLIGCFMLMASLQAVELIDEILTDSEPDIYDRIETLTDSLSVWSITNPQIINSLETDKIILDSTGIAQLFPGSIVKFNDSLNLSEISFPKYLELFSTILQLESDTNVFKWSVPLIITNSVITLDSIQLEYPATVVWDSMLTETVQNRVTFFRTTGLQISLREQLNLNWSEEFNVTVRGRDIIDIPYRMDEWKIALSRITAGMQVYAGLLSIAGEADSIIFNYYLLITVPNARGHHFIEWTERLQKAEASWLTVGIDIILTPYIRTDNLKNLFGTPDKSNREPFEIRMK